MSSECLYYTKEEVRLILGVSNTTLSRMLKRNEIPGYKKVSGMAKFLKSHFIPWAERPDKKEY